MSKKSHRSASPQMLDAIKFLLILQKPCEGGTSDHAWKTCRRCMAIHRLENMDPFALNLLRVAIDALSGAK